MVFDEKWAVYLIEESLIHDELFLSCSSQDSFCLYWQFGYDVCSCGSLQFNLQHSLRFLDVNTNIFYQSKEVFSHGFFERFFCSFFPLLRFPLFVCWYPYSVSHVSEALLIFLQIHFSFWSWMDNLNWLNFNFMDSFFYQLKSAMESL